MKTNKHRETAQRPWQSELQRKRALVNVGGEVETHGDRALTTVLARALTVTAGEGDATLTHPFHAYPARLHPSVARELIAAMKLAPGATVLDPFCGSGTVLIEAMMAGMNAVGRDLSPLAVALSTVKTRRTTNTERKAIVEAARRLSLRAHERLERGEREDPPRGESIWFERHTLAELSVLKSELENFGREQRDVLGKRVHEALRMLLSSVLVKVSLQASDTDTKRVHKGVEPGAALRFFSYKSRELRGCLGALAAGLPAGVTVELGVDDATVLSTVGEETVDVVVTSPPYANTYDYAEQHARRYAWLGFDTAEMKAREMGAARWFREPGAGVERFEWELGEMTKAMARVLRNAGRAVIVIADGAVQGRALRADEMLSVAASRAGLEVLAVASQSRPSWDDDSRVAFAHRARREHAVVLSKSFVSG